MGFLEVHLLIYALTMVILTAERGH